MQLAERKIVELREKLGGISAEFGEWLAEADENRPLRKHRTQITRFTEQLHGLTDAVGVEIDAVGHDQDDVLDVGRALQLRMLEVHRIWDFFRSKLSLRYVEWFRPYLGVLDEFAWACYACAAEKDKRADVPASALKAAPLVFLSGEFSPFLHRRQNPFTVEQVDDAPDTLEFLQLVHALPVPVVGLPWYQMTHLPDGVLLAHEIGHDVERSFQLTATTVDHLRSVQSRLHKDRRSGWFTWLPEVFADLYGVLTSGPAFVSALIDLLATDRAEVAAEPATPPWLPHPPAALRVALTSAALKVDFPAEAATLRATWAEAYPTSRSSAVNPFLDDVDLVVCALTRSPFRQFGDLTLREVATFTVTQQQAAQTAGEAARVGQVPPTADIRCLVAAARLAFDADPHGYHAAEPGRKSAQQMLLDRAQHVIDDKPRGEEQADPANDRAAGAALLDLVTRISRARGRRPPGTRGEEGAIDDI